MLISSARLALALEKKWEKKDTGNVKKKSIEEENTKSQMAKLRLCNEACVAMV